MKLSQRSSNMPSSPIRKLAKYADAAKRNGIHVYHLNIGQPDIKTPQCALDAVKTLDRAILEYSPSQGYIGLRTKLVSYYAKYGIDLSPDEIIITTGGSEAIMFAYMACLDPGDEIIVTDPSYANYMAFAISAGAVIRTISTTIEEGFCLPKVEKFEELINERTKAILICNPNNPTGYLYTKEELLKVYNYQVPANGERVKLVNNDGKEYEKIVENSGALSKTRDLFCFCAFTSLRYSDMATLKRTDIIDDTIYVTSHKTHDRLPIILNKYAKDILGKYKGGSYYNDTALPVISNQKMNDYLKDLCELCEINTPITRVGYRKGQRYEETYPKYQLIGTHAGRRTFICFALSNGVPPQVVMKWTGHNDYKAMRPYIDIAEKTKADAMKKIEDAFGE